MISLKNIQILEENMVYKNFLLRSLFAVIILSIYFIISYIDFKLVFYSILDILKKYQALQHEKFQFFYGINYMDFLGSQI